MPRFLIALTTLLVLCTEAAAQTWRYTLSASDNRQTILVPGQITYRDAAGSFDGVFGREVMSASYQRQGNALLYTTTHNGDRLTLLVRDSQYYHKALHMWRRDQIVAPSFGPNSFARILSRGAQNGVHRYREELVVNDLLVTACESQLDGAHRALRIDCSIGGGRMSLVRPKRVAQQDRRHPADDSARGVLF